MLSLRIKPVSPVDEGLYKNFLTVKVTRVNKKHWIVAIFAFYFVYSLTINFKMCQRDWLFVNAQGGQGSIAGQDIPKIQKC